MEVDDIKEALWIQETMKRHGFDAARAMAFLTAQYKGTVPPPLCLIIAELMKRREKKGTGSSQLRNLRSSLEDFAESLTHTCIQHVTEDEVYAWLDGWDENMPKTWNDKRGYVQSLFLFAIKKGWITRSPAAAIELRELGHAKIPHVLQPQEAANFMAWLEINEPEWVPYYSFCLFAGVRPDIVHGEAGRLHNDLIGLPGGLAGRVMNEQGFFVRGKKKSTRFVRWEECGPLHAWIKAYPCKHGLIPAGLSHFQAVRRLGAIRAKHSLAYDVMRHTAASAMLHVPAASFAAVAMRLENSEAILKKRYVGLWDLVRTVALYAIMPSACADARCAVPNLRTG